VDKPPLRLLSDTEANGNGVFRYGASAFPNQSWNASNYWVDLVFSDTGGSTPGDTTPPTVTAFTLPATAGTLTVQITTFTATDDVGVIGYLVTESATAPPAGASSWTATAPTSYTFASAGSKTLYAWAKDAAGNVSASQSAAVTITLTDTTPPTVTSTAPTSGATNVAVSTAVTAVFSEAMDAVSITADTFELRDASNALVPASVTYTAATRTATLTPNSALTASTTYTARVLGGPSGVTDLAGNALAADLTWPFTTAAPGSGVCATPCSLWDASATPAILADPDASPIELGVKFRSDVDGFITGLRFYKSAQNTGTHVGKLWSSGGTLLAEATFVNETASGWQQVDLGSPVAIQAGTTYVASYHTTVGRYSVNEGYFASAYTNGPLSALANSESSNGLYLYGSAGFPTNSYQSSNYWVDVVMTTSLGPDTTPPTVSTTSPVNGAANVLTGTEVKATFNEPMDAATVSTVTFELRNAGATLVASTVTYDAATRTATLKPSAALSLSSQFSATVKGGGSGVKDLAGNALAADVTWTFTTAASDPCATPANAVVAENCLAGNPPSEWDVSGAGDPS
jgi:hypothetical protein